MLRAIDSNGEIAVGIERSVPGLGEQPAALTSANIARARMPGRKKAERPWVEALLCDAGFVASDIGARGDLPEHWLVLDGVAQVVAFDADPEACKALNQVYDARGHGKLYRTVPLALGGADETRTFYLTASRSGSSFFNPDAPMLKAYTNDDYLSPIETRTLQVRNAQDVFDEIGVDRLDLVKLDIQGGELEVLQALHGGLLDTVMGLQTEAAMQRKGQGHPIFREIDSFMDANGFELFDLWPVRLHRARNGNRSGYLRDLFGVTVNSPTVAPRIWEVDAVYFRRPQWVLESGDAAAVRRLAVCYCVYGYFAEACHLLEQAETAGLLSPEDLETALAAVGRWHRRERYSWYYGTSTPAHLARRFAARARQVLSWLT